MLTFFARRMKELHEDDRKGEKGFTLIELLVVIIIIGILAAIAIPTFISQRQRAFDADANSVARNASTAAKVYYLDNNASYTGMDATKLDAIEKSLPNETNADPYTTYTVTPNTAGTDFTIVVKHKSGSKTFTATDAGITSATPAA